VLSHVAAAAAWDGLRAAYGEDVARRLFAEE
jgi:hypothetical protein